MMPFVSVRRASEVEIMDAGGYDAAEIRGNLADLRFFNQWFGGSRLVAREMAALVGSRTGATRPLSVVDVATGSADIPAYLARWGAARGIEVLAEGIDSNADVNEEARRFLSGQTGTAAEVEASRTVRLLRADALRIPHADRSIDVTVCSSFLHHLDSAGAVDALSEMRRVSRLGAIVVDLRRGAVPYAAIWLLTRLTTSNRLTRNDGPLSVKRAFTPGELAALARQAGMEGAVVRREGPVRMVLSWRRR